MSIHHSILLRYHEVALKGGNRRWFEDRLTLNACKLIRRALGSDTSIEIKRYHGRITLETQWNMQTQAALERVFGLSSFSPMRRVTTDKVAILEAALSAVEQFVHTHKKVPTSFRVKTRRSDKAFSETSMELDRFFGSAIHDAFPEMKVDLVHPELHVGIEIHFKDSFIWTEKFAGPGGLPVGTNSHLLCLMSGGLDSPVAAIQALRRGATAHFIHFYGTPFVGQEALEKVEDLVALVNRYQPDPQPLFVVPFGKIQERIALVTQPKVRTILYRRMMVRIANRLAEKLKIQALITGESLGQVASQTLENLAIINEVSSIPILRPLITYDKDEIIEQAQRWGTYETSIQPALDCCTLFADRHPILKASQGLVQDQESRFPVDEIVQQALEETSSHKVFEKTARE
jgi:tRNA uracil 4-sulfurtransferase